MVFSVKKIGDLNLNFCPSLFREIADKICHLFDGLCVSALHIKHCSFNS